MASTQFDPRQALPVEHDGGVRQRSTMPHAEPSKDDSLSLSDLEFCVEWQVETTTVSVHS